MPSLRSRRIWLALGVLAFAGLIAFVGVASARCTLPQISGTVHMPGLHGQVMVMRDKWGVPHIYAGDEHDLYVALGYVTAQDRLWQMLLRRLAARGQLGDWLGSSAASADDVLRRQDFPSHAAREWLSSDAETRAVFEAYTLGVNACLVTCPDPPELALLKRQGRVGQVAPWTEADSLALSRMVVWAQTEQSSAGLRIDLTSHLGAVRASELWPAGVEWTDPALPVDPTVRQVLRLAGIPLLSDNPPARIIAASALGLPADWYVATLHSEHIAQAGGTWPGVPGMMAGAATGMEGAMRIAVSAAPQRSLVEHLLALPPTGWLQVRVHGMLRQWNGDLSDKTRLGSASVAVYQAWIWRLACDTFQDELGEDFSRYWATGLAPQALARLAKESDNVWWDDMMTLQRETRDDVLRRAYAEALDDLGRHYGDLHTIWEWDTLHAAMFRHPLGGSWPMSWLLDRTVKLGGDAPFDPAHPDDLLNPYAPVLVSPLVIDRHPDGGMEFALAGGQSGNPFSPHYADLLPLWARGESVPLQDAVRLQDLQGIEGMLVLVP